MPIHTTIADRVAEIVIDHPPVNALDLAGWRALADALTAVGRRDDVGAAVLRANGRGFCAGVDIKELTANPRLIVEVNRACHDAFAAVYNCPVPVIAAAHGFVLGGGIGLVGAADLIVSAEDATFGLPEIDRGAMGAATHAMRMFGMHAARRMLLTGEPIGAAEAYRLGPLEPLVPAAELRDAALALAGTIASKSRVAVRLAKESLNGIELLDVPRSYRFEQGFTLELYTSSDSQEARDAFVERRDASWERGR
ncbi:MAG TPA: enoyl-CoA hydratase family protein [Conexibacter sp.]|jgi:enoyl-CoA hydratase